MSQSPFLEEGSSIKHGFDLPLKSGYKANALRGSLSIAPTPILPSTRANLLRVRSTLMSLDFKRRLPSQISLIKDKEMRDFLCIPILSVQGYMDSEKPRQTVEELFDLFSSGPAGIEWQKLYRKACVIHSYNGTLYEADERLTNFEKKRIFSIGEIFNPAYFPMWELETDDYKYSLLPINADPEYVKEFRETLRDILPDNVANVDRREVILENRGTKSLDSNGKSVEFYTSREQKLIPFAREGSVCKRIVIPTKPDGWRDGVLAEPDFVNSVKLIDRQVKIIINQFQQNMHIDDEDIFSAKLHNFYDDKSNKFLYLMRDIKKEGLTKPRYLLKIMCEELQRKYPSHHFAEVLNIYNSYKLSLEIDGVTKILTPERGHGLGMANALTTLMQIVIFKMVQLRALQEGCDPNDWDAIFLNDDAVLKAPIESGHDLLDVDSEVCERLGIILNKKKSFHSVDGLIFCERYLHRFDDFSKKESYERRNALLPYAAVNICHAKKISESICNRYSKLYLDEIVSYWGIEFDENEILWPAALGGWFSGSCLGLSTVLCDIDRLDYNRNHYRAWKACGASYVFKRRKLRFTKYLPAAKQFFNVSDFGDEALNKKFDLISKEGIFQKYMRLSMNREMFLSFWEGLYHTRHRIYNQFYSSIPLSKVDIIKKIYRENKFKDFIAPSVPGTKEIFVTGAYEVEYFDLYDIGFPLLRSLAKRTKKCRDIFPATDYPLLRETKTRKIPKNYSESFKILRKGNYDFDFSPFTTGLYDLEESLERMLYKSLNEYNSTIIASSIYYGSLIFPIWIEDRGLDKLKDELYGKQVMNHQLKCLIDEGIRAPECITLAAELNFANVDYELLRKIQKNLKVEFKSVRLILKEELIEELEEQSDEDEDFVRWLDSLSAPTPKGGGGEVAKEIDKSQLEAQFEALNTLQESSESDLEGSEEILPRPVPTGEEEEHATGDDTDEESDSGSGEEADASSTEVDDADQVEF